MIKKIINFKSKNISSAAIILAVSYLCSRIIGLIRDRLLAGTFGAGDELDIYYCAFRIPDLVYSLIVMGAISAGFIPVFVSYRSKKNSGKEWVLANNILNLILFSTIIICGILIIIAPFIVPLIAPGFSEEKILWTVKLTRIMFLSPIFLSVSAILGGILQSFKKFFIYSLAPVMYNLGIIFGILFLIKPFGLYGLAFSVVLGAFLHMLIQIPSAISCGFHYRFILDLFDAGIRRILRLMPARTLSLAVSQINFLGMTIIASFLSSGSITIYNFSYNLYAFPLGIFGVSFAIASFPYLSESFAEKNLEKFVSIFSSACRKILFLIIPISFLFIVLRYQLVKVILGTGKFSLKDINLTSLTLSLFCIGVFAEALILLLIRGFFAIEDTFTPFFVGIISISVRLASALILIKYLDVAGLALGYSLGSFIYFSLLWILLKKKIGFLDERNIFVRLCKIVFSASVSAFFSYISLILTGFLIGSHTAFGCFIQGIICGSIGIFVYILISHILKLSEVNIVDEFLSILRK